MKSFKDFCEQAFHPDLVNKLSDPKVQKNLKSTIIKPGERYSSGPPPMKLQSSPRIEPKEKKDSFVRRMIRNTLLSPIQ
jgi:hypothetical protein